MKFLLDTDSCIYLLTNAVPALTQRISECDEGSVVVSVITFAEIAHDSENGKLPSMEVLNAFASEIPLLSFDENAARAYSTLPFRRGRFDRLIAAHALSQGLIVVTNNESDFTDIQGLKVENWTLPLT